MDPPWVEPLRQLIQQHPTFGYRHLWAVLRRQTSQRVNKKAVYRVLRQKRWLVHQRSCTPRPRVQGWISRASRSDERWAMDVTHIPCGQDGWAHLAAVIDCHDREIVGYEFALRSRAKEAERAVEADACEPGARRAVDRRERAGDVVDEVDVGQCAGRRHILRSPKRERLRR